jgi:hypothetical protein
MPQIVVYLPYFSDRPRDKKSISLYILYLLLVCIMRVKSEEASNWLFVLALTSRQFEWALSINWQWTVAFEFNVCLPEGGRARVSRNCSFVYSSSIEIVVCFKETFKLRSFIRALFEFHHFSLFIREHQKMAFTKWKSSSITRPDVPHGDSMTAFPNGLSLSRPPSYVDG